MIGDSLEKFVRGGLVALVLIMPFHAFLSVSLGYVIGGQAYWQAWKELILLLLSLAVAILIWKRPNWRIPLKHPLVWLIGIYAIYSLVLTVMARQELIPALYGIKTNLEFLLAFVLAYIASTNHLKTLASKLILITSGIVAGFGLLQITILPRDFLTRFGYGPDTVVPFQLVDPNIDAVRILATLGGPNQLGSFLILPLCLAIVAMFKKFQWWQPLLLAALGTTLIHTYSRSAWIGAIAAASITLLLCLPRRLKIAFIGGGAALMLAAGLSLVWAIKVDHPIQYYVLHSSAERYHQAGSDSERTDAQEEGIQMFLSHPLGSGLGASGPASFTENEPVITENYYLQLAIEIGLLGLLLFIGICVALGLYLWQSRGMPESRALLGALVGISIINLVLHGWADSSTTLIYWIFAGIVARQAIQYSSPPQTERAP